MDHIHIAVISGILKVVHLFTRGLNTMVSNTNITMMNIKLTY